MIFANKLILSFFLLLQTPNQNDCLFRNPLCFFNTDILKYIQVLHNHQQYDKIMPFIHITDGSSYSTKKYLKTKLEESSFGYSLKRVGIQTITHGKEWSLTYQRTLYGTNENFKINCAVINDTCRILMDSKSIDLIFNK